MSTDMVRPAGDEFGKEHGLIHEVVVTGRKVGAGRDFWSALAHNQELFSKTVAFVARGGFEATNQRRAREIMGENFFGIEEAIKHFGVNPSEAQLATLAEIPFTEGTLEECKQTHVLVAVFPLSILDIRGKVEHQLFYHHEDGWYNREAFAKDRGKISWQLVRKKLIENSTSQSWQKQQLLLAKSEETPTARVMVYAMIGHFLATGERLFEGIYARCSDVDSNGRRVLVGFFLAYGLIIFHYWGGFCRDRLGVSSVRKFN